MQSLIPNSGKINRTVYLFGILGAVLSLTAYTSIGTDEGLNPDARRSATPRIQFIGVAFSQSESGGAACQYSLAGVESEDFTLSKGGLLLVRPFSSASVENWRLNISVQKNASGEDPVIGNASQRSSVRPNATEMFSLKSSLKNESHHIKLDCVSPSGIVVPAVYAPGFTMTPDTTGVVEVGLPPVPGAAATSGGPTMIIDD